MHELINENNIINIMRWASKLRLDTPLARAALKVLELQGENLIREKEIFDLLMELRCSPLHIRTRRKGNPPSS